MAKKIADVDYVKLDPVYNTEIVVALAGQEVDEELIKDFKFAPGYEPEQQKARAKERAAWLAEREAEEKAAIEAADEYLRKQKVELERAEKEQLNREEKQRAEIEASIKETEEKDKRELKEKYGIDLDAVAPTNGEATSNANNTGNNSKADEAPANGKTEKAKAK